MGPPSSVFGVTLTALFALGDAQPYYFGGRTIPIVPLYVRIPNHPKTLNLNDNPSVQHSPDLNVTNSTNLNYLNQILPNSQNLNNQNPNYQNPNYQNLNYQNPNYQTPNYPTPNYLYPNYQYAGYRSRMIQYPNYQYTSYQNPVIQYPNYQNPYAQTQNYAGNYQPASRTGKGLLNWLRSYDKYGQRKAKKDTSFDIVPTYSTTRDLGFEEEDSSSMLSGIKGLTSKLFSVVSALFSTGFDVFKWLAGMVGLSSS